MPSERITIYAGDPVRAVLDQAGGENRSGRINAVCQRYDSIIRDALTRLRITREEWSAIIDVHVGWTMDEADWQSVWARMLDAPEMDEKWNIDHKALGWRLHELPLSARAAVAEIIERYWCAQAIDDVTHDELMQRAGASWPTPKES